MTIRRGTISGVASRGSLLPKHRFSLVLSPRNVFVSGESNTPVIVNDAAYIDHTDATYDSVADACVSLEHADAEIDGLTFWSDNEAVAVVDAYGHMTRVTDGTVRIYGRNTNGHTVASRTVAVSRIVSGSTRSFAGWVYGSLAAHVSDTLDVALTVSPDTALFTSQDHTAGTYVRNTSCWLNGIDLTCMPVWNSYRGQRNALTPISPLHAITVKHWPGYAGYTYRFVTMDNQVVDRVVATRYDLPDTDLSVSKFTEPLPESIRFARVLPADISVLLPTISAGTFNSYPTIPIIRTNQFGEATLSDCCQIKNGSTYWRPPASALRLASYRGVAMYDSGHPCFLIDGDGELVLVCPIASYPGGNDVSGNHAAINAAMTALGGGYQLTDADLSEFEV